MTGSVWTGAAAAAVFIILIFACLWRPLRPNPQRDDNGEAFDRHPQVSVRGVMVDEAESEPCSRAMAVNEGSSADRARIAQALGNIIDDAPPRADGMGGPPRSPKPIDWRIDALHKLWRGQISEAGITQLLAGGADIGKFTVDKARRALAAIEAGKPMMRRVEALLEERGEEDTQVTILHHGTGRYCAIIRRGRHRGSAMVSDEMGANEMISAVIGATEKLRAPQEGSFLGAAGGPTDVFEQGPVSAKSEDGGEG